MNKVDIRGQKTVLIVEDQALMRQTLRNFLQGAFPSCNFCEAADGASALEACKTHVPLLVLMDKCLPDADGVELTARLKSLYPDIQVIVVSHRSGEAYVKHALAAGARAYVVKDDLFTDLIPAVAAAIGIAPVADTGSFLVESLDSLIRWVLLTVDGQTYALHLEAVDRILRMAEVTPLPGAPEVVEGVINIQGEVVTIVSIRRRLGLAQRAVGVADSLVLARTRTRRIAIIAESILGVVERPADAVVSAGDIARGIRHIEGVLKTSDGLVLIQDLDRFFSPEDEQSLDLALKKG